MIWPWTMGQISQHSDNLKWTLTDVAVYPAKMANDQALGMVGNVPKNAVGLIVMSSNSCNSRKDSRSKKVSMHRATGLVHVCQITVIVDKMTGTYFMVKIKEQMANHESKDNFSICVNMY